MRLVGANAKAPASGLDKLPGKVNYFIGNDPSKWRTNIPIFGKVRYAAVYRGVDLTYYGNQRQLEYDFVVAPGADPRSIAIEFKGAPARLDEDGNLVISAGGSEVVLRRPVVYQQIDRSRKLIDGGYTFLARTGRLGFKVANCDRTRPLVIDPVLAYSTLLGGAQVDQGNAIAIDRAGNAYITGFTCSSDFPTTMGAYRVTSYNGQVGCPGQGDYDVFVTKLNPSGSGLVYSTYLGGTDLDVAAAIAVDGSGNAYIAGQTFSNDFPTTASAFQTVCAKEFVYSGTCGQTFVANCKFEHGARRTASLPSWR